MGNCQAAETALPAAVIEHPDGKNERIYRPITASHLMSVNPGYYVAVIISSGGGDGEITTVKHARLLQTTDFVHVGHVYRLVSFEEVLTVFGSKKRVRLSRLIGRDDEVGKSSPEMSVGPSIGCNGGRTNSSVWRQGQWKPTLHSIEEMGI